MKSKLLFTFQSSYRLTSASCGTIPAITESAADPIRSKITPGPSLWLAILHVSKIPACTSPYTTATLPIPKPNNYIIRVINHHKLTKIVRKKYITSKLFLVVKMLFESGKSRGGAELGGAGRLAPTTPGGNGDTSYCTATCITLFPFHLYWNLTLPYSL